MTTIVHCLASETNKMVLKDPSKQGLTFQCMGHSIKYLGLDLLSLFLLLSGVSCGLKAIWILPPPWGSAAQKVIDEKQGFGMSESNQQYK